VLQREVIHFYTLTGLNRKVHRPEVPRQCPPVLMATVGWKLGKALASEEDERYLRMQLVPRSKHFSSELQKPIS